MIVKFFTTLYEQSKCFHNKIMYVYMYMLPKLSEHVVLCIGVGALLLLLILNRFILRIAYISS